jgi:hypothetical protein
MVSPIPSATKHSSPVTQPEYISAVYTVAIVALLASVAAVTVIIILTKKKK